MTALTTATPAFQALFSTAADAATPTTRSASVRTRWPDRGPFRNRGGLVRAVTGVADERTAAGELTQTRRRVLIEAAARARFPS
ncbi:hypothetical protein [Streptomyces olivaceoviridis]|uniref:hypothetical protein n=1 Tax=Streptomyces olivaceoviridis TaxID=1921 RepID=UPI00331ADFC4